MKSEIDKKNACKMLGKYEGTRTGQNLLTAFLDESSANNKYLFFASRARKDGLEQIAALLEKTALNEKEHAKIWYKELFGIDDTLRNLETAAVTEYIEWNDSYRRYARIADEEGFKELAVRFRAVARIEQNHEDMLLKLADNLRNNETFARSMIKIWECRNCGNIIIAEKAPETCSVCDHPQAFYELKAENY